MNDDFDRSRYARQRTTRAGYSGVPNTAPQASNASGAATATASRPSASPDTHATKATRKSRAPRRGAGVLDVRRHWWKYLIGLVLIGVLAFFIVNYFKTKNQLESLKGSKSSADSTEQQLLNEIGGYMVLPTDETPTTATVNDVSKLKDQVFFMNAKDGDKVIIYAKAKRAILYRPSEKKIVEYSPINIGSNPQP